MHDVWNTNLLDREFQTEYYYSLHLECIMCLVSTIFIHISLCKLTANDCNYKPLVIL